MKEKIAVEEWAKNELDTLDHSPVLAVGIVVKMLPVILNWQLVALIGISLNI